MLKKYKEFINENLQNILPDYILPIGSVTFLTLFFRNLIQDRRNRKYKNVFINDIFPNLKSGRVTMTEDADFILIDIPEYEIEIDKNKKSIWFLNKKTGSLNLPWRQEEREDGGINIDIARAQMRYPLKLNKDEFNELLKLLRESKTNEEADYRNVTGNGTMGNPSDQNAGPSFNKGPDSATYRRPSVIGVETDDIKDPYFAQRRDQKRQRVKKNQKVEKNRKDKAKYLDGLEKDSQNKVDESIWDFWRKNKNIKNKFIKETEYESFKEIFDKFGNIIDVCKYLNEKYKNKLVHIIDIRPPFKGGIFLIDEFDLIGQEPNKDFLSLKYWKRVKNNILINRTYFEEIVFSKNDKICEVDMVKYIPDKNINDPYDEEQWEEEGRINESIEQTEKDLEKIKKILPKAYTIVTSKIDGKPYLMEIVCNANDYVKLGDDTASFAGNAFDTLQDLDDMIFDLLNVHAKNIEVGNIEIDDESDGNLTLRADTLYFDNVQRHILLSEGDYDPDPFWVVSPNELDCSEDMIKERDPNKPIDPNDPYDEEEWNDEMNGWRAWWD